MIKQKQYENEVLSAYMDAELADDDVHNVITRLLDDADYKEQYMRLQQVNSHLQEHISIDITAQVSSALEDLPRHFVEDAVTLQTPQTETLSIFSNWHWLTGGVSVAASVMFVTFVSLYLFDASFDRQNKPLDKVADSNTSPKTRTPSINNPLSTHELPSSPVAFVANPVEQNYQWQDADPVMSQYIRAYIHKHGIPREAYSLQAKVRSAAYQTEH